MLLDPTSKDADVSLTWPPGTCSNISNRVRAVFDVVTMLWRRTHKGMPLADYVKCIAGDSEDEDIADARSTESR
jgi:hypothetical protein